MNSSDSGGGLTRKEFDLVIRRAAELASSDADSGDRRLDEGELMRIAQEVGLSPSHVRQALSEVRSGQVGGGPLDRVFGPSVVRARRAVPGTPKQLAGTFDEFFVASQLLQPVRRGTNRLQYRPSVDWASQLARAASFTSKKYYVASAKSVEVHLEELDTERTLVELTVDPGTRTEYLWGAGLGGGSAGAATGVTGTAILVSALSLPPVGAAVLAGTVGAGIWGGIAWATGRGHKKKMLEVQAEVEGILDRLEVGESLKPPPAAWRRWVKRQFHGVARDLVGDAPHEDEELYEDPDRTTS